MTLNNDVTYKKNKTLFLFSCKTLYTQGSEIILRNRFTTFHWNTSVNI